ncbi:hypothetical protein AVEN_35657-1 [Araneus ventricosus]|uniref:Uncharacterized protein n=1 Tax=Araneus ventricosus TaxID=182803 RepID=A0A4Y2C139_ARAVE|nr:hypothetical protein AVEN_35657-1 [Araneus ventricosus]
MYNTVKEHESSSTLLFYSGMNQSGMRNTKQSHKLLGGQLLAMLFHKLIAIIVIHLQSHDLRLRLVDYRLHRFSYQGSRASDECFTWSTWTLRSSISDT